MTQLKQLFSLEEAEGKIVFKSSSVEDGVIIVFTDNTFIAMLDNYDLSVEVSMAEPSFVDMGIVTTEEHLIAVAEEEVAWQKQYEENVRRIEQKQYDADIATYKRLKERFDALETSN